MKVDITLGDGYIACSFTKSEFTSHGELEKIMYSLATGYLQSDTGAFHGENLIAFCESLEPNIRYKIVFDASQSGGKAQLIYGHATLLRKY